MNVKKRIEYKPSSPPPSHEGEDEDKSHGKNKSGGKILGGAEFFQHNQVFFLIAGIIVILSLLAVAIFFGTQEGSCFEQFVDVLDRALFILLGFYVNETIAKKDLQSKGG